MTPTEIRDVLIPQHFDPFWWTAEVRRGRLTITHGREPLSFTVTQDEVTVTSCQPNEPAVTTSRAAPDGDVLGALLTLASEEGAGILGFSELPKAAQLLKLRRHGGDAIATAFVWPVADPCAEVINASPVGVVWQAGGLRDDEAAVFIGHVGGPHAHPRNASAKSYLKVWAERGTWWVTHGLTYNDPMRLKRCAFEGESLASLLARTVKDRHGHGGLDVVRMDP